MFINKKLQNYKYSESKSTQRVIGDLYREYLGESAIDFENI